MFSLLRRPIVCQASARGALGAFVTCVLTAVSAVTCAQAPDAEASRPEMREDAELAGVFFLDPDQGYAVGDRGVIWATVDGGRHWNQQESGVSCRLNSICFVDDQVGCAVGGWSHPYTHRTHGVVLHTRDGGDHWEQVKGISLPTLHRVRFVDARQGWAIGESSPLYPSGVFHTEDGGRSWTGTRGMNASLWQAGDVHDATSGALVSSASEWANLNRGAIQESRGPDLGIANARDLRINGESGGWCVGDGGMVLQTADGGRSWQRPPGLLPRDAAYLCDFRAVASLGAECWIAGAPGSIVLHSPNAGRTWETFHTDQSLPIHALTFCDASRGWAVGSLGTILATRDGGRTWRPQRAGGKRVALLAIVSQPQSIPFELIAREAGDEGYLVAVELITSDGAQRPSRTGATIDRRTHEAVVQTGASAANSAWQFKLFEPGVLVSRNDMIGGWNDAPNSQAVARLEEYIVRKIRQWRPDVIVTERLGRSEDGELPRIINQVVQSATNKAAAHDAFSHQLTSGKLAPWKVKKIIAPTTDPNNAMMQIVATGLSPNLGRSLNDVAGEGRALIDVCPQVPQTIIGLSILQSDRPESSGRHDLFGGIALEAGGEARRLRGPPAAASLAEVKRTIQKQRNIEQLLARSTEDSLAGMGWLAQIDDLTSGLSHDSAADVLFQLAARYQDAGQAELAAEVYVHLVQRFGKHPLVEPALVWLVQYYASSEATWRLQRSATGSQTQPVVRLADFQQPSGIDKQPADTGDPLNGTLVTIESRAKKCLDVARLIEQVDPALHAEPAVRFPAAVATRLAGSSADAMRAFNAMVQSPGQDHWKPCARTEIWLSEPTRAAPKYVVNCASSTTRPRLDGKLDEPVWRDRATIELSGRLPDEAFGPAKVMLAHDDQFLYLAATCRKAESFSYPTSADPRPRDPDLSNRDRIDFLIDVDRDYSTYYRLTIDHRGWVAESCLGDPTWNPEWFVAASDDGDTWTMEAAIEIQELAPSLPAKNEAWAIGVQRTIPGVGFQSWTTPAAVDPIPTGFGIVRFDE